VSAARGGDGASKATRTALQRAVFLDRDGTIILNDGDLGDPSRVELLPGVAEGVRQLCANDYAIVVVTNQGGVARGKYDEAAVHATHAQLERVLCEATGLPQVVHAFYFCPFHPEGSVKAYRREHPWRKPAPGMLLAAAQEHALDLPASWMVGDQERDVQAGAAAGCRSILIGAANGTSDADYFARNVNEAATRILHVDAPQVAAGVVTLHAAHPNLLEDAALRLAITAAAESLAERTGVRLFPLEWTGSQLTATLAGGEIVALGFAAELRRATQRWWQGHGGSGTFRSPAATGPRWRSHGRAPAWAGRAGSPVGAGSGSLGGDPHASSQRPTDGVSGERPRAVRRLPASGSLAPAPADGGRAEGGHGDGVWQRTVLGSMPTHRHGGVAWRWTNAACICVPAHRNPEGIGGAAPSPSNARPPAGWSPPRPCGSSGRWPQGCQRRMTLSRRWWPWCCWPWPNGATSSARVGSAAPCWRTWLSL
jgi:D-glycero-D-manno-heptose 1,7-bisphosphate phosphatase